MPYLLANRDIVSGVELYRSTIFLSLTLNSFKGFRPRLIDFYPFKNAKPGHFFNNATAPKPLLVFLLYRPFSVLIEQG